MKYLVGILTLLLLAIPTQAEIILRSRDVKYRNYKGRRQHDEWAKQIIQKNPQWLTGIVPIKSKDGWCEKCQKHHLGYASGVVVGYNKTKNISYVVTAHHVINKMMLKSDIRIVTARNSKGEATHYRIHNIISVTHHRRKDFSTVEVSGRLPIARILDHRPKGWDIIIGYEGQQWADKIIREGRGRPGQSGGAVISHTHGVHSIVSTTHDGVLIYKALKEMDKLYMIGITFKNNQQAD